MENNRSIENVSVTVGKEHRTTDRNGCFTFHFPPGNHELSTRHVGYEDTSISLSISRDTGIVITLTPASYKLAESTVRGSRQRPAISGLSGGRVDLDMEQLRVLPKFIGANDPMKILQLLPGVQTSGEGNSGIFIRGGEPGHNMIVWNDAPIYNVSHLLGSFSIFNTGHIGHFRLYKSSMDAAFGGRLSSLIEVESPNRIPEKTTVSGDIGIIASQFTFSTPVNKKSALYLSGRTTYIGLLLKGFIRATSHGKNQNMPFDYDFRDGNLTYAYCPRQQDKIILNAYWGGDKLKISEEDYELNGSISWSNLATSLQWQHRFTDFCQLKNSVYYSRYYNRLKATQSSLSLRLPSSIQDFGYKNQIVFPLMGMALKAGLNYTFHVIDPQSPQLITGDANRGQSTQQTYYTHEAAVFISDKIRLTPSLTATLGFRYALNVQTGPYNQMTYNERGEVTDSVHYGAGRKVAGFHSAEPRIALNYTFTETSRLEVSYNRQKQFINLVSISGVGLPTDFWVPASKNIPPQSSDNFSTGYFRSMDNNGYELSVEAYYKRLHRQMEFKSALFDLFNQQYILEESIHYGKGKAYGAELMFKKNSGKLTGWISYTLGWSKRNFPAIEANRTFSAKHDRRHDLSITSCYEFNKKWDFSAVFVYATGNAYTMPKGIYMMGNNIVKEYGHYNGSRMPAYHRLDISANYWFFKHKNRESGLNFSIYNVYKHQNPVYIFIVAKPGKQGNNQIFINRKEKRLYDIIPSISWTFRF